MVHRCAKTRLVKNGSLGFETIILNPIGSMYAIYGNIGGILMGSMLPYIAYMDPMGMGMSQHPFP